MKDQIANYVDNDLFNEWFEFFGMFQEFEQTTILFTGGDYINQKEKDQITKLGHILLNSMPNLKVRIGNLTESDFAFAIGATEIDIDRIQVITHNTKFQQQWNQMYDYYPIDKIEYSEMADDIKIEKEDLLDEQIAKQVCSHVKVLGAKFFDLGKVDIVLLFDDEKDENVNAIKEICRIKQVPYLTQETWLNWL